MYILTSKPLMQFEQSNLYHIYNRGNNKQPIFFKRDNYLYFLNKVKKYISPNCDILAWCLMPNHFHFLIHANTNTLKLVKETPLKINSLTEGLRLLLSSYTLGINVQLNRTGNLFQQKTKSNVFLKEMKIMGILLFNTFIKTPLRQILLQKWKIGNLVHLLIMPDYETARSVTRN